MVYCGEYNCTNESASGWSMHSFSQNKISLRNWLPNMNIVQWKPTCQLTTSKNVFVISSSMARSVAVCDINARPLDRDQCFRARSSISATGFNGKTKTSTELQANTNSYPSNNQTDDLLINLWLIKEKTHKWLHLLYPIKSWTHAFRLWIKLA